MMPCIAPSHHRTASQLDACTMRPAASHEVSSDTFVEWNPSPMRFCILHSKPTTLLLTSLSLSPSHFHPHSNNKSIFSACSGFSPQPHGLSAAAAAAPSHRSVSSLCCGGASGISMSLNRRSLLSGLPSAAFLLAPLAPPSPALAQGNYVPTDGYELAPIVKNGKVRAAILALPWISGEK
jgi:hypothetical protein